jgi:hypothetical protein
VALALASVTAFVATFAAASRARAGADNTVTLDVTLDPDRGPLFGRAQLRIRNTSGQTLASVPLWLYPNHLAARPASLGDVNFHWLYPGQFSPAAMEIGDARVDGAPAAFAVEDTDAGARTLARVTLPAPLPPGGTVTLEVAFETTVPRRLGGFGCDGPRCRLMGGFYPTPAHLGAGGWDLSAAPDRVDARVTVRAPEDLTLIVDGELLLRRAGEPVTVASADVPYPTIVTDRTFRASSIDAGGVHAEYLHRSARPPDSEDQPLPYVREDIPGLVLEATRRALEFLGEQGLPEGWAGGGRRLTLVEAPLRHELVQVHGDVILVSDQIFGIFPVARLRKYHRFELVRAVFLATLDASLARTEAPEDRELAAGVLAAYLLEVFTLREFKKIEFARDLLRPLDFIPAVDRLIYAPLVASSATYFGDVDDADPVRDDVRRFSHKNPSPRLVYNKLLDLLGPEGMTRLPREVLGAGQPLRKAAATIFGSDLDWFWRQWLGPRPRVNYRLADVKITPRATGVHVAVVVAREGDDVLEPVEVRVEDRAGGAQTLTWNARGPRATLETDLPAGLASVEIDPRARLLETAVGSLRPSDDPRYDDRDPRRWRFIYEGFGALLNVTQVTAAFEAAFVLKPQHDLRHAIVLRAYHTEATTIGVAGSFDWFFGAQADRNTLTSALIAGLSASRLDPSFGLAAGETARPGTSVRARLGVDHDTRDFIFDPWHAVGFDAEVSYGTILLDDGRRFPQVGLVAEALRLIELLPGHVLAVDLQAAAQLGSFAVRAQLTDAGGIDGLRGYLPSQLLARANVIGRVQLRDDYVTGLGWNLLHFTTVRGLAGTLFADAAAVTTCDGYAFSRDRVFSDVGYSFRVLHDGFGVYQQLLSIDFAVPLTSRAAGGTCLGQPAPALEGEASAWPRPRGTVLITFLPNF